MFAESKVILTEPKRSASLATRAVSGIIFIENLFFFTTQKLNTRFQKSTHIPNESKLGFGRFDPIPLLVIFIPIRFSFSKTFN
jgi:hypothetical protein